MYEVRLSEDAEKVFAKCDKALAKKYDCSEDAVNEIVSIITQSDLG